MFEQLLRDAVSHSTNPALSGNSTTQPPTMNVIHPPSASLAEQHQDMPSSRNSGSDSLTHANWLTATSPASQQLWQCGASERSPGCTTIASIGYMEADMSPSWQSLSNQESQYTAPASPAGAVPDSKVLKTADGDSSSHHKDAPMKTATPAASAVPSSNASSHYKTKRCRHFDQSGWCPYQHRCVFAHGDREFTLYTAQKGSGNGSKADDSSPTASQLVREHIERNVQQLVEEYELAVAEAGAKAAGKNNNAGGPPAAHGPRGAPMDNTAEGPAMTIVRKLSPTQPPPPPPLLPAASQHHTSNVHLLAATPLAPPTMLMNGASNSLAQFQVSHPQYSQQYHAHHQQPPMLNQHPLIISTMNGAPAGSTFPILAPNQSSVPASQSFHALPSYQQQQQQRPMMFAMPSGALGVLQVHPHQQQQQQQQQIYFVEAPYYNVMAANGGNAGVPMAPAGYPSVSAGPLNGIVTARLV
ncbi:hypothetical protein JKF63_01097 [Porcisia hertigi]|uniref:C3H1-type domain-containing protein n=1 Tax=Porcisia hertigi TaxID=2761500 RepID=A0A836HJ46_9TRYP|nr:hypothetical protein JKF63_01097 [Porcisia hertigi]